MILRFEHFSNQELRAFHALLATDHRYGSYAYATLLLAEVLLELHRRALITVKSEAGA